MGSEDARWNTIYAGTGIFGTNTIVVGEIEIGSEVNPSGPDFLTISNPIKTGQIILGSGSDTVVISATGGGVQIIGASGPVGAGVITSDLNMTGYNIINCPAILSGTDLNMEASNVNTDATTTISLKIDSINKVLISETGININVSMVVDSVVQDTLKDAWGSALRNTPITHNIHVSMLKTMSF